MIEGLSILLGFQAVGELLSWLLLPVIPGPVLGLVLLLVFLKTRRRVPDSVDKVSSGILQHLGLLFVPASVGVVMFAPQLRAHGLALLLTLFVSVLATIAVSGLVLRWHSPDPETGESSELEHSDAQ